MAKVTPIGLDLDQEVAGLVSRIGGLNNPENYIQEYKVHRAIGDVTLVTVTLVADEHFSSPKRTTTSTEGK